LALTKWWFEYKSKFWLYSLLKLEITLAQPTTSDPPSVYQYWPILGIFWPNATKILFPIQNHLFSCPQFYYLNDNNVFSTNLRREPTFPRMRKQKFAHNPSIASNVSQSILVWFNFANICWYEKDAEVLRKTNNTRARKHCPH